MSASDVPPAQAPVKKRHVVAGVAMMGALGAISGGIGTQFLSRGPAPTTLVGFLDTHTTSIYGAGIYHVPATVPNAAVPAPEDLEAFPATEMHGIDEKPDVADLLAHIAAARPEPAAASPAVYRWEVELSVLSGEARRYIFLSETAPLGMIGDGGYVRFADMSLVRYLTVRFPRATRLDDAKRDPAPIAR